MLQIATLARSQLRESTGLVRDFVLGQLQEGGGFRDRDGKSDLYYTVFGIESLLALKARLPADPVREYVANFGDGEGLDLVHLACLARCNASEGMDVLTPAQRTGVLRRLPTFRSPDGGYRSDPGRGKSTVYGCFLALGAYQDLGASFPDPAIVCEFVRSMETPDGAYANDTSMQEGSTPATAAAITFLRHFAVPPSRGVADWLLARCHKEGGFFAAPRAPVPDLLSTAVALHALANLEIPLKPVRESCLDFLDKLWTSRGSFYAHWTETALDTEYTFYGLLALGHLSV